MELILKRKEFDTHTEGVLTIKGHTFSCDTLEDPNRDKNKNRELLLYYRPHSI